MGSIASLAKGVVNKYAPSEHARWVIHQALCLISQPTALEKERFGYCVAKEKGFVFLVNPSVVSQSTSPALPAYARRENFDLALRIYEVRSGPDEDLSGYFKFCFVRNPWEQSVSWFHKRHK